MDKTPLRRCLAIAVKAAQRAGEYLAGQKSATQIIDASFAHDLKLRADRDSERLVIDHLRKHTAFSILSEERGMLKGSDEKYCWVVDPLDGTINYFHQLPLSCVCIALCVGGQPKLGVIYDFHRQELFTGIVGEGAWLNGRRMRVSSVAKKREAVMATGFPGKDKVSVAEINLFARHVRTYKKVRLLGSAALSMAYVAAGRLDAYFEKDIWLWDVAAGVAIVRAAAGKAILTAPDKSYMCEVFAHNGKLGK